MHAAWAVRNVTHIGRLTRIELGAGLTLEQGRKGPMVCRSSCRSWLGIKANRCRCSFDYRNSPLSSFRTSLAGVLFHAAGERFDGGDKNTGIDWFGADVSCSACFCDL